MRVVQEKMRMNKVSGEKKGTFYFFSFNISLHCFIVTSWSLYTMRVAQTEISDKQLPKLNAAIWATEDYSPRAQLEHLHSLVTDYNNQQWQKKSLSSCKCPKFLIFLWAFIIFILTLKSDSLLLIWFGGSETVYGTKKTGRQRSHPFIHMFGRIWLEKEWAVTFCCWVFSKRNTNINKSLHDNNFIITPVCHQQT